MLIGIKIQRRYQLRNATYGFLLLALCSVVHAESLVARGVYVGKGLRGTDPYEVGFRFKTGNEPRSIEALGFIDLNNTNPDFSPDGDGLISPVTVSLWEEARPRRAVAQVSIPSGSAGLLMDGFRYVAIDPGPVTLAANTDYVLSFDAGTVADGWLDAGTGVILNSYFVGSNSSSTWEVRWGDAGEMPTTTGAWGIGQTYGCVNLVDALPGYGSAYNPTPADQHPAAGEKGSNGVDVVLSWTTGQDPDDARNPVPEITNHRLYLKADDAEFSGVAPIVVDAGSPPSASASHTVTNLDPGRAYYWRVDEELSNGAAVVEGEVWSFTTLVPSNSNQVVIDPSNKAQVFEGFGEGTMDQFVPYWYSVYPAENLESYLDQLYTLDGLGLGLNICRVLMPVGDAPGHAHHNRMWLIGNVAPKSFEPEEGVFDWTGHESILWRHQGAAQRGAIMWANWFSMPYWLTISGCTSGASDGLQNLISGREARFVEHACDVLDHYKNNWGIDFDYVSLINECEATWWTEFGGQPGCYVASTQAVNIIQELESELTSRGHGAKQIAYDAAYATSWWYLDHLLGSSVEPFIDVISFHQYTTSASGSDAWKTRAQTYSKSLWQTEWGDWGNAGYPNDLPHQQALNHAAKLSEALNDFSASAWVLWEPDFIFDVDAAGFHPREAYWVTAQYSRHIRPGMQRIDSSDSDSSCRTTAWVDHSSKQLVLVSYNSGAEAVTIDYDLAPYQVVRIMEIRQTSESQDYESMPFTQPSGNTFSLTVPAESVTTLIASVDDLYVAWTIDHGVTNGPLDDHDLDGLINLYEYGLNGNPTNGFIDAELPFLTQGDSSLDYIHGQRNDDTNLLYYLLLTDNLIVPNWTNHGYMVTGTNAGGGVLDYVTNRIDTTASAKFIKLEIEQVQE